MRLAIVIAAVAVVAGGAALASASIPDSDGVIHACYNPSGVLRVVNAPSETCGSGQTPLSWSQSGPPGPPGPSEAITGFSSGADIPDQFDTTIAQLTVPEAGSYVLLAKFWVFNHGDPLGGAVAVCKLVAGSDVDDVEAGTGGAESDQVPSASVALTVTHTFPQPGTAELRCGDSGAALEAESIRMTAIKVGALTNEPLS